MSKPSIKREKRSKRCKKKQLSTVVNCYCEGETEIEYVNRFIKGKNSQYKIKTARMNSIKLMYERYKKECKKNKDHIYVFIFDNDNNYNDNKSKDYFYKIIKEAIDNNILLYYSNLCFELWFIQVLSKYKYNKEIYNQKDYYKELNQLLGIKEYSKYKGLKIIDIIAEKEEFGIKREVIYQEYMEQIDNLNTTTNDIKNILNTNPYTNICFLEHDLKEAIKNRK